MTVDSLIVSALSSLSLPVYADVYTGDEADYITFNYADERPALRADDTDIYDETTIQVHYFTKSIQTQQRKPFGGYYARVALLIISTSQFYEDDTKYRHVVVEAWIEGTIND